jgi:hypothetical protein
VACYNNIECEEETRQRFIDELSQRNAVKSGDEPPKPHISAPPKKVDLRKFTRIMEEHKDSYSALEGE